MPKNMNDFKYIKVSLDNLKLNQRRYKLLIIIVKFSILKLIFSQTQNAENFHPWYIHLKAAKNIMTNSK